MCSYQTRDRAGDPVTLGENDRITSINGQACTYYVSEVRPKPAVTRFPRLKTWPVILEPTSLAGGAVVAGLAHTLAGQVKFEERERKSAEEGMNSPTTKGYFIVLNANQADPARLLYVYFADAPKAQVYSNAFAVAMVELTELTPPDPDAGDPGTFTETAVPLACSEVEVQTRTETRDGVEVLLGDARIVVSATAASLARLKAAGWFTIAPNGQPAEKYAISPAGITLLANTQYEILLIRKAQ